MSWRQTVLYYASTFLAQTTTTNNTAVEGEYAGYWTRGDWWAAIAQPFTDTFGQLTAVILGVGLMGMLFIWSGSISLPVAVAILIGGLMVPYGPPIMQMGGFILIMIGGGVAAWKAWMGGGRR